MKLSTYLESCGKGAAARLAKQIGVTPVLVSQWRAGSRQIPVARCLDIERATAGSVCCEDSRPDIDWSYLRSGKDFEALP